MAESEAADNPVFDLERLRQLIELMKEHDLTEVDLRQERQRIRLARGGAPGAVGSLPPAGVAVPVPAPAASPVPAPVAPSSAEAEGPGIVMIRSPMVGTFFSRANPNAEPYVRVGDHITPETTVCIIEAMKVFNEIPAEVRGRVVAVLVDDEVPVDYGKPLFKIDTSG